MRSAPVIVTAVIGFAVLSSCSDDCESLPPSFQLDITSMGPMASLEVRVRLGPDTHERTFNLDGALDDGETSLAIELDPSLTSGFEVEITVNGWSAADGRGSIVASAQQRFIGTGDGCNRFSLALDPMGGDSCNETCNDRECDFSCSGGCGACAFTCSGVGECETVCLGSRVCEVDCRGSGECTARCQGNASCRIDCAGAAECRFTRCDGAEMTCPDGSIVCDHACPP